ncbi:hypothetical protein ACUJ8N_07670 [Streptomyces sp. ESR1.13]|uniref:hypothetical protein n=1 Tax=unclassified Streptomyces TaxID=2593676 RepID=UPI0040433263
MRTLRADAERAEAVALVQDRQRWLTLRGLPVPAHADVPALFRDPQTKPAGLFEDGKLLAGMVPERGSGFRRGEGPCLVLTSVHTLPAQADDSTRLITLWASDFAARQDLPVVRTEVLVHHGLAAPPVAALLRRLTDMGWALRGQVAGPEDGRVARLELAAERRAGLTALIGGHVHEPQPATGAGGSTW